MNIKKILVLVLALLLISTMLACGGKKKEEEKDPNAIEAQQWAIAIDYGYPDEEGYYEEEQTVEETTEQAGEIDPVTREPVD